MIVLGNSAQGCTAPGSSALLEHEMRQNIIHLNGFIATFSHTPDYVQARHELPLDLCDHKPAPIFFNPPNGRHAQVAHALNQYSWHDNAPPSPHHPLHTYSLQKRSQIQSGSSFRFPKPKEGLPCRPRIVRKTAGRGVIAFSSDRR